MDELFNDICNKIILVNFKLLKSNNHNYVVTCVHHILMFQKYKLHDAL